MRLLSAVFIPDAEDETQLQLLGTDVSLLVMTIDHNLIATFRQMSAIISAK